MSILEGGKNTQKSIEDEEAYNTKQHDTPNSLIDERGFFMGSLLQLKSISAAKQEFTRIVREALKGHEVMAGNAKRNDMETVSIIATEDLMYVLDTGFKFHVDMSDDEDGFVINVKELSIFGYGLTMDEAKEDLVENLVEYLNDYFARSDFFKQIPQRKAHYPYLRRLAKCTNNEEILEVVLECYNLHSMR